jgi:hypothetical protein
MSSKNVIDCSKVEDVHSLMFYQNRSVPIRSRDSNVFIEDLKNKKMFKERVSSINMFSDMNSISISTSWSNPFWDLVNIYSDAHGGDEYNFEITFRTMFSDDLCNNGVIIYYDYVFHNCKLVDVRNHLSSTSKEDGSRRLTFKYTDKQILRVQEI